MIYRISPFFVTLNETLNTDFEGTPLFDAEYLKKQYKTYINRNFHMP